MKSIEIKRNNISIDYRFEYSYYLYNVKLKQNKLQYFVLKDLSEIISDGEHSAIPRIKEKGIRYLYGRNIKDGIVNFDPNTDSSYISEKDYKKFKRIHLKENDILLTIVGTVGKIALYKQKYIGIAGIPRHIAKIRLKDGCEISQEYIVAFFLSKLGKKQIENITTGNIQPLLSIGNIEKLDIPIVPTDMHNEITEKMKKFIDAEISSLEKISQAQSLFYYRIGVDFSAIEKENIFSVQKSFFADSDLWTPTYSYPLYVSTLRAIQSKWQTIKLGDIATLKKGDEVGSDNYIGYLDKRKTDVPFIRTSDIVNYETDQYPDFYIPEEIYKELNQDIKAGDVIFTNDGKIGQVGIITKNDKIILQSHIKRIRLKKEAIERYNITAEYLFLCLSIKELTIYQAKRYTVIQSTIPTISNRLLDFEIPILDTSTIDEITQLVKSAFELKDKKKRLINEVREKMDSYFEI